MKGINFNRLYIIYTIIIMKYLWIGTISFIVLATKSAAEAADIFTDNEISRVVGGKQAEDGQFPYVAALYENDQYVCGASIISRTALLTAAHCVVIEGEQQPAEIYYAHVGTSNRSSSRTTQVTFRKITVHPYYKSTHLDDIAILETSEPLQFGDTIQPICIAAPNMGKLLFRKVTAMGWGYLKEGQTTNPDSLQYVQQRVIPNIKCRLLYFFTAPMPETLMCAKGLASGVCGGDSGGPLVYAAKSGAVQVGVNGFVNNLFGCGTILGPAGFARVSSYTDFIMDNAPGDICVESRS